MTKDEIIELAKEAGFRVKNFTIPTIAAQHSNGSWVSIDEELEAFANTIQAKERERCAKAIENGHFLHDQSPAKMFAVQAAAAIRSLE